MLTESHAYLTLQVTATINQYFVSWLQNIMNHCK